MTNNTVHIPCAFILDEETAAYIHLSVAAEHEDYTGGTVRVPRDVKKFMAKGRLGKNIRAHSKILDKMGCFDKQAAANYLDSCTIEGPQVSSIVADEGVSVTSLNDGSVITAHGPILFVTPELDLQTGKERDYGSAAEAGEMFRKSILSCICRECNSQFPVDFDWTSRVVAIDGPVRDKEGAI